METKIRKAKKADIAACAKILAREFRKQGENWTLKTAKERLFSLLFLQEHRRGASFCLAKGNKIIGLMFTETIPYINGKTCWIAELVVEASEQGKGHGKRMLEFMEEYAKKKGFNALMLGANKRERAFSVYRRFGFKESNYHMMEKKL